METAKGEQTHGGRSHIHATGCSAGNVHHVDTDAWNESDITFASKTYTGTSQLAAGEVLRNVIGNSRFATH